MKQRLFILFVISLAAGIMDAAVRHVPANYSTIQSGINAAVNGDTVLVAPGTYYENIHFRGKNIVVASNYILNNDPSAILSTIINGSTPQSPDSASCVRIVSGEDTTAVLEGFTLTRGVGTRWGDEHGAGTFREGGGILVTLASPTIKNNLIVDNEAINTTNSVSAGGGGIRLGDSKARILNNVIMSNKGMYGGGIVLNYCSGMIIRNNVIVHNIVYQATNAPTFGGGGLWLLLRIPGNITPNIIENNTIVGNNSTGDGSGQAGRGGGVVFQSVDVIGRNNVIWANRQTVGGQIYGPMPLTYSDVEGGYSGTGNVAFSPEFVDSALYLSGGSLLIDAGDPDASFNDPEGPGNPGSAEWPSLGTLRNDIGAYGGPARSILAPRFRGNIYLASRTFNFGYLLPGSSAHVAFSLLNQGGRRLMIDSIRIRTHNDVITIGNSLPLSISSGESDTVHVTWSPDTNIILRDTLLLFHNDPEIENPLQIELTGNSIPTPALYVNTAENNFGNIDVNIPSRDTVFHVRNIGTAPDSVYVTLNYQAVQPPSGIHVTPAAFAIASGDSQAVTFSFFPPVIVRTFLSIYAPVVKIDSRFGLGTTHFEKTMRFRLVGALDVTDDGPVPRKFSLEQNYPNPFNPKTTIKYQLPVRSHVSLKVYDILGKEVATLVDEVQDSGFKSAEWDATSVASGVYLYRMKAGDVVLSRRMMAVR